MSGSVVHFLVLGALLFLGCAGRQGDSGLTSDTASHATDPSRSGQRTARYRADSFAQVRFSRMLMQFMDHLIDRTDLRQDTSWYQELDTGIAFEGQFIMRPRWGDLPADSVSFPFKDLHMSYHAGKQHDYFLINGSKVEEKVYTGDNRFFVSSMHRFRHGSGDYLVFNGGLPDYNGYGGRIQFNYFFDLSPGRVVSSDMYENCWGFVDKPFLYGKLNDDPYLDRITFDGICRPSGQAYDTMTLEARTYRNRNWQRLRDRNGEPYTIKLLINEEQHVIRLGTVNWMRPVSLPTVH